MSDPEAEDREAERPVDVPIDVPIPAAGGPAQRLGLGRARWITLALLALGAAGGAWVILSAVAERRLEELRWQVEACLDASEPDLELDPRRCAPEGETLVARWPKTKDEAGELTAGWQRRIDGLNLARAARVELDAGARDSAAEAVLAGPEPRARSLREAGAHAEYVAFALDSDDPELQHDALTSAAMLGDWEAYTELARSAYDNESIAWLCLRDPEAGRAAIAEARAASVGGDSFAKLRYRPMDLELIARLCEDGDAAGEREPPTVSESWIVAAKVAAGQLSGKDWLDELRGEGDGPVLAQTIRREDPSEDEILRWLAPRTSESLALAMLFQPREELVALRSGELVASRLPLFDPATMFEAATELAELAEAAEPRPGEPPPDSGIHPELWSAPAPALRHAAAVLASEAAYEWITSGELEDARAAASLAERCFAPEHRAIAWALEIFADEAEAALEPLAERRAELAADPESQREAVELGMLELRALTRLGRWPEAHELAHTLHEFEGREGAAFIDDDGQGIALWHVALITQLDLDEDPPGLDLERGAGWAAERSPKHDFTDDDRPRWSPNELAQLLVVARDARLARRWRATRVRPPAPKPASAAVAVGRMIASWAHDPAAEELWLDLAVPSLFRPDRGYFSTRAELARWRGDPEAEQRWRSRRASLLALAPSSEDRVLLHLAGL